MGKTSILIGCVFALALAYPAGAAVDITELGTLGGSYSVGYSVNNSGAVTGASQTADGYNHAFVWAGGTMIDVGTLGGSNSRGRSISDTGLVAGYSDTDQYETHAFLWDNGVISDVGHIGGGYSIAYGVNDYGKVVGVSCDADWYFRAFESDEGGMVVLPDLGVPDCQAFGVNNNGVTVGQAADSEGVIRAVRWENGQIENLGIAGAATSVNDLGDVVGIAYIEGTGWNAYILSEGVLYTLPALGGGYSYPYAVNENKQIVGQSTSSDNKTRACLWENGQCIDLNTLLPPDSGWDLIEAIGINDLGDITGWGYYEGDPRAFLIGSEKTIPVVIDVNPGKIMLKDKGNGSVKAVIFARPAEGRTEYFDVTQLDLSTVRLAGAPVQPSNNSYKAVYTDVDLDGYNDLMLFFTTDSLELKAGDTEARLTGKTMSGQDVEGSAAVTVTEKTKKQK